MEWFESVTTGNVAWGIFTSVLTTLGFLLALMLLSQILRERKPPANSMAWLIAILALPWVAVPMYLLIGQRKLRKFRDSKVLEHRRPNEDCDCPDRIVLNHSADGVFAATCANRIRLIPDGKQAFEETIELIRGAKSSIYLATYIFSADQTGDVIRDELAARARDGLDVCVLVDGYGAMFLSRRYFRLLTEAGGKLGFHGSLFRLRGKGRTNLRNHRKMIICDGSHGIIGGMNVAEEYMGAHDYDGRWYDLAARVEGPVVGDLHDVFLADWKFACDEDLEPFTETQPAEGSDCDVLAQIIASGPDVNGDPLHEALLVSLYSATDRFWLVTPYFIPDTSLMHGFRIAVRRGVDVRIITPQRSNHLMADLARASYLHQLHDEGVKIHLFQAGMLHAKAILVDSNLCMLGSANIDMRSLFLNFEVTLCARSDALAQSVEEMMQSLMGLSTDQWPRRKVVRELFEGVGRLLAPLL